MTILERPTTTIERPEQTLPEQPAPERHPRRYRIAAVIAAVLVALAAVGLGILMLRDDSTATPSDAPVELDPATGQLPSGPSGLASDAPLTVELNPATEQVPSGSAFDRS